MSSNNINKNSELNNFTFKELKKEAMNKGFKVSNLRRQEIETFILNHRPKFLHLLNDYWLVYFGAGLDFRPINKPLYKTFNRYIDIDALPKLSHYESGMSGYEKSKDEKSLIKTLKKEAFKYNFKLVSKEGNLLTFEFKERTRTICYLVTCRRFLSL